MQTTEPVRPVALVTGASRPRGIGAVIAQRLARDGWDLALTYWRPYDARMPWRSDPDDITSIEAQLRSVGATVARIEADLAETTAPARIFGTVESKLGTVSALVLAHCESVASGILDTSLASFDRHFAVNVRASWLLIREFATRFDADHRRGKGRIVALTSDHVAGNLPYGASKGALDRIVVAAAEELRHLGVSCNVINPGPTDTGWMTEAQMIETAQRVPLGRVSLPEDCANLVSFLCSPEGAWINAQVLYSNGGFR